MSLRESVLAAIDSLAEVLEVLDAEEAVEPVEPPTEEEISMNVSGTPDLHLRDRKQFDKMAKYYNPAKVPFTSETWVMTGMLGFGSKKRLASGYLPDPRPYKVEDRDGVAFQRYPQQMGADWYWIAMGVSDVTAKEWNKLEMARNQPREVQLDNIRKYQGGLRGSIAGWPLYMKEAYNETH